MRGVARIFISTAEPSADLLASLLVRRLRGAVVEAAGGERLQEAGARVVFRSTGWGVIGVWEGVRRLPRLWREIRPLFRYLRERPPDVLVVVDAPFLHLRLIREMRQAVRRIVYLASPVSWQWLGARPYLVDRRPEEVGAGRLRILGRYVDLSVPLYRFAVPFYEKAGVSYYYGGHLLMREWRARYPLWRDGEVMAVFPGSREQEVRALMPRFARALQLLGVRGAVVSVACEPLRRLVEPWARKARMEIYRGDAAALLARCRVAVMASGTIVQEATALQVPGVAAYWVPLLLGLWTEAFGMRLPFYTYANLMARKAVMPEFVRPGWRVEDLADAVRELWEDEERRKRMSEQLRKIAEREAEGEGWEPLVRRMEEWLHG